MDRVWLGPPRTVMQERERERGPETTRERLKPFNVVAPWIK